ncbi:recombinase family protein, partial [Amycolatopsis sp. cmx-4-68]|uniref:recombinase family protein n=1 Tax=Amycolatopsis sp. cmx-4-68 TaxID=2790938 RepID=UPI00397DA4BE
PTVANIAEVRRDYAAEAAAIVERLCAQFAGLLAQVPTSGEWPGAIYLRISEDRQNDELKVETQFEKLLQLFVARGFSLDRRHIFVDNDRSAKHAGTRPDFARLLEVIKQRRLRVVGARDMTRLTRNRGDQLALFEPAEEAGILLMFARGADIDMGSTSGQIIADVLAAVARDEIKVKGDRHRDENLAAAQRGEPPSGPVPLGFNDDRVTHHPEQAEMVRQAYADLLAGATLSGIARKLNAAGMRSGKTRWARGKEGQECMWSPNSVRHMLLAPRNAGLRAYKGEIVGKAVWDPIVPEDTWRDAVALLGDSGRRQRKPTPRHLLSGIARCPCGEFVTAGRAGRTGDHGFTYRCSLKDKASFGQTNAGAAVPVHVARRGDHVDAWIGHLVVERLSRDDAGELLLRPHDGPSVTELHAERARLRGKLETLTRQWMADKNANDIEYQEGKRFAREQLQRLNEQIEEMGQYNVLAPLIYAEDVEAAWIELMPDRKRAVIEVLFESITFLPPGRGARNFNPATVVEVWRVRGGEA